MEQVYVGGDPGQIQLVFQKGKTGNFTVEFLADGVAFDFTGSTLTLQFKDKYGGTVLLTPTYTFKDDDPTLGIVTFIVSEAETGNKDKVRDGGTHVLGLVDSAETSSVVWFGTIAVEVR